VSTTRVAKPKTIAMTSESGVAYSIETVTPTTAEEWLGHNTANRRIRRNQVERFARDMEVGAWQENGEGICFATDGTLINGQHRLSALVLAGVALPMLVVRGLPMHAQDTMDDGAKRTMGDTFSFHGVASHHTAAAIVRRVLMWQDGIRTNSGAMQPSKAEQLEAWRTDSTLRAAVEASVQMRSRGQVPSSIVGLTWWLFSQIDGEQCATFWHGLHTGSDLPANSPIHAVREKIIRRNAQPGRVQETEYLAWIIKAWNLWRADRTVSPTYRGFDLKPGQNFPEPR
jgi:hypothetical protein